MDWFYLAFITLIGAIIQSATGFGFGLIAVPIFLFIMGSTDAIQLVTIIILCMSIVDWMKLRGHSSRQLLIRLNMGLMFGFPLGLLVFQSVNLILLKLIIALIILVFCIFSFINLIRQQKLTIKSVEETKNWQTSLVGFISGVMTTSIAMPGPSVMVYLVRQHLDKTLIRATILTYFIFAYAGALLLQMLTVGITIQTWKMGFQLLPVAFVGVFIGHYIAPKINQKRFKQITLSILIIMSFVMLFQL